ncbi:peptidase C15, pyroglutamyl peptidase I-like protein [Pseudovirgaria hyperparasitica]|uniref:Peptidase C15, pyroglutamyl peptidase I-like protein n=1 Tax=Pseudovirgaria hyperparasitica TaxID=470096 RepID=A0A6A6VTQ4_9PEZI|nr:peptidase C15, pyroglutamyl peptidase I-like protein [Pseudovirgaria hyperparasitica]KAF2753269.1 peptidase C15, pyroglutamyl peptidase I-like protein [Pseudovirgaria hyperparasitica]
MARKKEYKVVVTGAAPFKEYERNPTQDVKDMLPTRIERNHRIPITIIKFPKDFRNVITDMDIIPKMWNGQKRVYDEDCEEGDKIYIDAMLHLGMNFDEYWQIERVARRDGYDWVGDDGVPLPKHNGGKGGRWEGLPEVLKPMFDIEHIDVPFKSSTDAGLLYCEFIFYTSLAALYTRDEDSRVTFLHHAGKKIEPKDIKVGAQVAEAVICSLIDQIEKNSTCQLRSLA